MKTSFSLLSVLSPTCLLNPTPPTHFLKFPSLHLPAPTPSLPRRLLLFPLPRDIQCIEQTQKQIWDFSSYSIKRSFHSAISSIYQNNFDNHLTIQFGYLLYMCIVGTCHCSHVEVRGQLVGLGSFFSPWRFWKSNSVYSLVWGKYLYCRAALLSCS